MNGVLASRLVILLAIGSAAAVMNTASAGGSQSGAEEPRGVVRTWSQKDALGVIHRAGAPPQRIVSLSPNLTEILFAVGVDRRRIVGVTRFCDYPPQVEGIARIGGIIDPSIEAILALRPDLVLATRGNPTVILDRLRTAGVPTYAFESQGGIDLIEQTMRAMVELVAPDDTTRAREAVESFSTGLACLGETASGLREASRPKVYYYDPASPDWTAGPGTHVNEAISIAGARNIAEESNLAWPRLSLEFLVARAPEFLVVAAHAADTGEVARKAILDRLRERAGWRDLPAVREGSLCLVPADWLLRPGPRLLPAIRMLGRCLHPEVAWGCGR